MNSILNILGVKKGSKSFSSPPKMSVARTGWMSSVETRQMSAVETGQMSAAETGQMSAVPESSGFPSACGAYEEAPAGV